jgi:prepilin-type N-terminal cleavage/methylation domain-containing protein
MRTKQARGFTLIELMLVVVITGIMSGLAVFTLTATANSSRERGAARGVSALIKRARTTAMQQHRIVRVEPVLQGGVTVGLKLQSCAAQFGTNLCAGAALQADVVNAVILVGRQDESRGVTLTAPPGLEFNVVGMVVGGGTYDFVIDHPGTVGATTVRVSAGGDVRVQ